MLFRSVVAKRGKVYAARLGYMLRRSGQMTRTGGHGTDAAGRAVGAEAGSSASRRLSSKMPLRAFGRYAVDGFAKP